MMTSNEVSGSNFKEGKLEFRENGNYATTPLFTELKLFSTALCKFPEIDPIFIPVGQLQTEKFITCRGFIGYCFVFRPLCHR